jgi:SAM-dependent methyltransferase
MFISSILIFIILLFNLLPALLHRNTSFCAFSDIFGILGFIERFRVYGSIILVVMLIVGNDNGRWSCLPWAVCPSCGGKGLERDPGDAFGEFDAVCPGCGFRAPARRGVIDLLGHADGLIACEARAWESLAGEEPSDPAQLQACLASASRLPFLGPGDAPEGEAETWRRHGRQAFRLLDGRDWAGLKVIEVGAGRCWLSAELARRGAKAVALDIVSHPAVGLRAGEAFFAEGIYFERVLADMQRIPFASGTFDAAAATAALHHSPDPAALMRELARVVRPGGTLHFANEPLSFPLRESSAEEEAGAHEGYYSLGRWLVLLRQAGWSVMALEVGDWGDLHAVAVNDGSGSPPPPTAWARACLRYSALLLLAPPRRLCAALRRFAATHPARPLAGSRLAWLRARFLGPSGLAWEPVFGPGWYAEEGGEEPFRWSGPRSFAVIPTGGAGCEPALEMASFRPDIASHPVEAELRLGGGPWVRVRIDRPGWKRVALAQSGGSARRRLLLRLRVRRGDYVPAAQGWGEDNRRLGVACRFTPPR